jgi:hypothetical protein
MRSNRWGRGDRDGSRAGSGWTRWWAAAAYQRENTGLGFRVGVGTTRWDLNENGISFRRQSLARFALSPAAH